MNHIDIESVEPLEELSTAALRDLERKLVARISDLRRLTKTDRNHVFPEYRTALDRIIAIRRDRGAL